MQQIAVEPIGLQPRQRALACLDGSSAGCVARQHLRHEKNLIASPLDRPRHKRLGLAIHLGGIDMGHAEIDAALERSDRGGVVAAVHLPGPLPDDRDVCAGIA
jgi:hypothetical protein